MAPIKFDENIKNKLEKRTIQPSSDAWNTLSDRLDAQDKRSSRSLFFYIGIAASIVGVLFVSTLVFNSSEDQTVSPIVVDSELNDIQDAAEETMTSNPIELAETSIEAIDSNQEVKDKTTPIESVIKNESKVATISEKNKSKEVIEKQPLPIVERKESLASNDNRVKDKKKVQPLNSLTFEQVKANEVVAEIKKLEAEGNVVSDAEIEDLLKQAEKDILRQRIYNETTRTVDADALLQDVEEDLEQSFRSKVFESLKSSYKTVKTAVAERNN